MRFGTNFLSLLLSGLILIGCNQTKVETFHEKEWQINCVNSVKVFTKKCERKKIGESVDEEDPIVFIITLAMDAAIVHFDNKKIKKQCDESREPEAVDECHEYRIKSRETLTDSSVIMSFSSQDWKIKCLEKDPVTCKNFLLLKKNKGQKYQKD